jgi:hypothetical protein
MYNTILNYSSPCKNGLTISSKPSFGQTTLTAEPRQTTLPNARDAPPFPNAERRRQFVATTPLSIERHGSSLSTAFSRTMLTT